MFSIKEKVHGYYWDKDINCAKTMLSCLSEIYGVELDAQIIDGAIGLAGAGQFRAQCGLVEGGLIFIGIYFTKLGYSELEVRNMCYQYAEQFQEKFGSLKCYDLRPAGFSPNNLPHMCEKLTCEAVEFANNFIIKCGKKQI